MKTFLGVLTALLLSACSIGSPDGNVAAEIAESFYKVQQSGDIDAALPFYSINRSPEQWRSHLENIRDSLGTVEKYALKVSEVNTVLSGRYFIFEYQVQYSSGTPAKETVTLFDTVEPDDKTLIVAHTISADGYRPLF